jgi:hypothetical protein
MQNGMGDDDFGHQGLLATFCGSIAARIIPEYLSSKAAMRFQIVGWQRLQG